MNVDKFEDLDYSGYGFYYIAGYTEGGMPYGITYEEAVSQGLITKEELEKENYFDDIFLGL